MGWLATQKRETCCFFVCVILFICFSALPVFRLGAFLSSALNVFFFLLVCLNELQILQPINALFGGGGCCECPCVSFFFGGVGATAYGTSTENASKWTKEQVRCVHTRRARETNGCKWKDRLRSQWDISFTGIFCLRAVDRNSTSFWWGGGWSYFGAGEAARWRVGLPQSMEAQVIWVRCVCAENWVHVNINPEAIVDMARLQLNSSKIFAARSIPSTPG